MKYKNSILGGTFDHFHRGHKFFIDTAFKESENVTIGLAQDSLFHNKFLVTSIEEYKLRFEALESYLSEKDYLNRAKIIPLNNIYGNSLEDKDIDAVFIVQSGSENAHLINRARAKKSFQPLEIIIVPPVFGGDGKVISSTRIRTGEIDRDGNSYVGFFSRGKSWILPEYLREDLAIPKGKILKDKNELFLEAKNASFVITVGDMVTAFLNQMGLAPHLAIFDFKTQRGKITDEKILNSLFNSGVSFKNTPGTISKEVILLINKNIEKALQEGQKQMIKIEGEEDLLTLPSVILAPLNAVVFYGQSGLGSVAIQVTEDKKAEFIHLLEKFKVRI